MARFKSPIGGKQKDVATNPSANPVNNELANKNLPQASDSMAVTSGATPVESTRQDAKKVLGVVKNESRPHVVPINLEDEIRRRAYELAERRGFSEGHETEDWLTAEREILQRYRQQSA